MNTIKNFIAVAMFALALVACNENAPEVKTVDAGKTTKTEIAAADLKSTEFTIEGMTCAIGCAATIETRLNKMEGVKTAKVDFDSKKATVEFDGSKLNEDDIALEVVSVGDGNTYKVYNMAKAEETAKEAHTCTDACKDKKECTAEMKANCTGKKDGKMACCAEKKA